MTWRIRWLLADKLEAWAKRLRPQIPEAPRDYTVEMRWPEMPPAPALSNVLAKLTEDAT